MDLYLAAIQTCLPFLVEKGHRVWFYVVVEHLYGVRTLFKTFRLELFTDYGRIMSQFLNLYDQNHIPNQNRYLLKVQTKKNLSQNFFGPSLQLLNQNIWDI